MIKKVTCVNTQYSSLAVNCAFNYLRVAGKVLLTNGVDFLETPKDLLHNNSTVRIISLHLRKLVYPRNGKLIMKRVPGPAKKRQIRYEKSTFTVENCPTRVNFEFLRQNDFNF